MLRRAPLVALLFAAITVPAGAAIAVKGDRDKDGMPDRWEQRHKVKLPGLDADHDGLKNRAEFRCGTDPRKRDTDRDGLPDGREDADRDGLTNAQEAKDGTDCRVKDVVEPTLKKGRLTLVLPGGKVLTGRVTDATDVECDNGEPAPVEEGEEPDPDAPASCREQLEDGAEVVAGKVVAGVWTLVQLASTDDGEPGDDEGVPADDEDLAALLADEESE